ncbi:MAG: lipopolysaccharide biosynthesis protein [Formivibrio sp.]|nr:lipopolysaccharide biosynthesis protein [Formivibrio sp.]
MGLRIKFFHASIWDGASRLAVNAIAFGIFLLLARLVGPGKFGQVAFAAVFAEIITPFATTGLSQAIIQRSDWDEDFAATVFWTNIIVCSALAVMVWVGALLLIRVGHREVGAILSWLAVIPAITSISATHEAKLQRDMRFQALARRNIYAAFGGGGIGVFLALMGWGVWALVTSRIIVVLLQTILGWQAARWVPRRYFSMRLLKSHGSFAGYLTGVAFMAQMSSRAPDIIIGVILSPAAVGFFRVGSRLLSAATDVVVTPLQRVALAGLSRLETPQRIASAYLRMSSLCGFVAFPLFFGIAAIAPEITLLLFGPRWLPSAIVMLWLSPLAALTCVTAFTPSVLTAAKRADLNFSYSLTSLVATIVAVLSFAHFGLRWAAIGLMLRGLLLTGVGLALVKKATALDLRAVATSLFPAFGCAAAMGTCVWYARAAVLPGVNALTKLAILIPAGAILYGVLIVLLTPSTLRSVKNELTGLNMADAPAP